MILTQVADQEKSDRSYRVAGIMHYRPFTAVHGDVPYKVQIQQIHVICNVKDVAQQGYTLNSTKSNLVCPLVSWTVLSSRYELGYYLASSKGG